jgi:hypothetical protein
MDGMTKEQIEAVFERVRSWPLERQVMTEEQNQLFEPLTEEERADLEEALAEAEREDPVPDEEVRAVFERYRQPR